MLSPEFPPVGGGATTRVTKLVRYLARQGIELEVVAEPPRPHHPLDLERLKQIPEQVVVHRPLPPRRWMAFLAWLERDRFRGALRVYHALEPGFPDRLCWWCLGAWPEARKAASRADIVWTTGPPYSTHLLGYALRRLCGRPWIMDCRDPWTQNFSYRGQGLRRRLEQAVEGHLLRSADRVVAVTRSLAAELSRQFGRQVVHLSNGFDPEDLPEPTPPQGKVRRLVYAGVLNRYRDPEPLARALLQLDRDDVQLEFLGPLWRDLGPAAQELQQRGRLLLQGHQSHEQALAALASADVGLVLGESHPASTVAVGGKVYELLALGIPLLALTMEGEMSQILRQGGARVVHPLDEAAIGEALRELLEQPRRLRPPADGEHPQSYAVIARQLVQILQEVKGAT